MEIKRKKRNRLPTTYIRRTKYASSVRLREMPIKKKVMLEHYLKTTDIYVSYKYAGYEGRGKSGRISARRIFRTFDFQKELQRRYAIRKAKLEVDADVLLKELGLLATSNMVDFAKWDNGSLVLRKSKELSREETACIRSISETVRAGTSTLKITLHPKTESLKMLFQHLGLTEGLGKKLKGGKQKVEHSGTIKVDMDKLREMDRGDIEKLTDIVREAGTVSGTGRKTEDSSSGKEPPIIH